MENELVRYSRAGDVFHYRWAARRCLRMIYPQSQIRCIVIEGSKESKLAGEYVIDLTEYSDASKEEAQAVIYYQLKHTTVRKEQPFTLSGLKDTIKGFAKRYFDHFCKTDKILTSLVTFSIVTNRPVDRNFKHKIAAIAKGNIVDTRFQTTLENYTSLKGNDLNKFCALLEFVDEEGDYSEQRYRLHFEISQLVAGTVDSPQINNITALVQEKALPDSDGKITREDVLIRLGATSERQLFPAPPAFEEIDNPIPRKQHQELLDRIIGSSSSIIIHAAGGVGKTIFACQIAQSLPQGSLGIVYDCFGGGRYRNESELRHRHRDALVQIANELAAYGLSDPLIAQSTTLDDQILREFLARLEIAAGTLKKKDEHAILLIIIDAADNAEMAAKEFSHSCFVHKLLREEVPDGCRLVALCRTERKDLLQPSPAILQLELEPFSEEETLIHLRRRFPEANDTDGLEFHRLTGGNPRVQANALSMGFATVTETLDSLGPAGTTIQDQIEVQLDAAIAILKGKLPGDYQNHIDTLCIGLANLPPLIPLPVLAAAAGVEESAVKSFVADLGRPLWLSDAAVHFRDEPTETWFREKYAATIDQISAYIKRLKPLSETYTYVAEALPALLLRTENYGELIDLALSDDFLPENNPIDKRNVRVYRLRFAFKAALKAKQYTDAVKLALRAGEEVAGDKRQLELLTENVDLIAPLQNAQRVQELAFRRMLRGGWDGSENIYSAALLSSVQDFKGEARGYLREAENWLQLYFEKRKKNKHNMYDDLLRIEDIVELVFTNFNLFGIDETVNALLRWRPPVVYDITQKFIRRLVDTGKFEAIGEIAKIGSRNQYLIIAIAHEMLEVGRFPNADVMEDSLILLSMRRTRIKKPQYSYYDTSITALVSFLEACAARHLSETKILRVLRHYIPIRAPKIVSSDVSEKERDRYLRAAAIRCVFAKDYKPDLDDLLPEELRGEKTGQYNQEKEIREFREIVGGLLPWYIIRARIIVNDTGDILEAIKDAAHSSTEALSHRMRDRDHIRFEVPRLYVDILTFFHSADSFLLVKFYTDYIKENMNLRFMDHIKLVRSAYRLNHLTEIRHLLEQSVCEIVNSMKDESPEAQAGSYIKLARAVLPVSPADAAAYFDYAIDAVSKFGDEIVQRWEAVAALANRSAQDGHTTPEMAYRFIRCAELIGDTVVGEKYFDRNGAVRICTRLSPVSALAALSRWRDRDVGWFNRQLPALADELVRSHYLSPAAGWALSAFFGEDELDDFASLCIENEPAPSRRQYILDNAIRDMRLNEAQEKSWQKLKHAAQQHSVTNKELDELLVFYAQNPVKVKEEETGRSPLPPSQNDREVDLEWILNDLDVTTSSGISFAIKRFDAASTLYRDYKAFWQAIFSTINENDACKFLYALVDAENVGMYKIQDAISHMPDNWRRKASIRRNWEKILKRIARRFAPELTNHYTLKYFIKDIQAGDDIIPLFHKGILEGLSDINDLSDANTFFGFVEIASSLIDQQQATALLDFALQRFELHIANDYADGTWADWLYPPENISTAFTGFIWSALGSPRAEIRWRAAHSVRRLAEIGCEKEIDELIGWLKQDRVDAFGSRRFPFYNLHARLYLLIALVRVSIDFPQILKRHSNVFSYYALENIPHILIQKFSSEIVLYIEKTFPNTYSSDIVEQCRQAGISQLPVKEIDSYNADFNSYWHTQGKVDTNLKFYHGWDFDRYWFEPLGKVFGISGKQVEELATEVVINEWHIKTGGDFIKDPRDRMWRSSRHDREMIYHSHGEYPLINNYTFYISYHAMLTVAARLLQKMPVVHTCSWYEDEWAVWLQWHSLTRNDGHWLADRRDPAPLLQREWIHQKKSENWCSEIDANDFLDGLFVKHEGETWLNVAGFWEDGNSECRESYYISSALVSPTTSQSLLNALTTCSNPHDFKLPGFQEENMEFELSPFVLKGWILSKDPSIGIDKFDPFAGTISFPPCEIGQSIIEKLGLSVDAEQREWFSRDTDKAALRCELWSTNKPGLDKDPHRKGKRLSAALTFLQKLCAIKECELIIKIQINRRYIDDYYTRNEHDREYKPPHYRIFILTADGKLRDTETHYQLR